MGWVSKDQRKRTESACRALRYAERKAAAGKLTAEQLKEARLRWKRQNKALLQEAAQ